MISQGARRFAKFATRATPKHSFKAYSSVGMNSVPLGKAPSISSLAAMLKPIPPSMTNSAVGIVLSSSRALSTSTSNASEVEEVSEKGKALMDGASIDATEDLQAILESSRGRLVIVDFHARLSTIEIKKD